MSTNALYGHLTINGVDALAEYGFVIMRGSMESWLQMPEMKPAFSHNWKDEHGIEVDLSNRYMKEKQVSLNVLFIVDNELEFWTKYKRALVALTAPGLLTVYYRELDKEFEVFYTKCTSPKAHTRLKNIDKIAVSMTLHFTMPDPSKMVERLVAPTAVHLHVPARIVGKAAFTFDVEPATASRSVRVSVIPLSGDAFVAGNEIHATRAGTVRVRAESALDASIADEQVVTVFPENIIYFEDGSMLEDGFEPITAY